MVQFPARLVVKLVDLHARLRHRRLVATFRERLGYSPTFALPRSYNEKHQWRKIFDHNPLFATFCDKLACKAYIAEHFPEIPTARTLWQGTSARDIPDAALDGDVVIKQSNASSRNIFISDGAHDRREIEETVERWLATPPYGRRKGEWAYGQTVPRVFVEERLTASPGEQLVDCNFWCMGGVCIYAQLFVGKKTPQWAYGHYLPDGQPVPTRVVDRLTKKRAPLPADFEPPSEYATVRRFAERLSADIDHVRCDFMIADGRICLSEMTVYHGSGFDAHDDETLLGPAAALWDLRKSWFLTTPQRGWRGLYARALKSLLDQEAPEP